MGCAQSNDSSEAVNKAANGPAELRLLAVIVVHYNPQRYERRAVLVNECLQRLEATRRRCLESNSVQLILQAVELTYDDDAPDLQVHLLPNVRILRRNATRRNIMWSKEQLINIAIRDLAPAIQHVVWLDSDIAFEDDSWAESVSDTLYKNPMAFGQVWSKCRMLGPEKEIQRTLTSFAAQMEQGKQYQPLSNRHGEYWHPGFAWMATREALKATDGLIDRTLGSADRHMAMAFLGRAAETVPKEMHPNYVAKVMDWQAAVRRNNIQFVVAGAAIFHYWHGSLKQRGYMERWKVLLDFDFDPITHVCYDNATGLLEWSEDCPDGLISAIGDYFASRLEDSNDVMADDVEANNDIAFPSADDGGETSAPSPADKDDALDNPDEAGDSSGMVAAVPVATHDAYATAATNDHPFNYYA